MKNSKTNKSCEDDNFEATRNAALTEEEQNRWQQNQMNSQSASETNADEVGWGSWGNWGSSLVSAATSFTQELGHGVGTVLETVEESLGVPNPEVMAKEVKLAEEKMRKASMESFEQGSDSNSVSSSMKNESSFSEQSREENSKSSLGFGGFSAFGSIVSGVSGVFETASNTVLLGGLDTLEMIGRKTMDVLQDGDPGLRNKRAFLSNKNPNLSSMLQEARHTAAQEEIKRKSGGKDLKDSEMPSLNTVWKATDGPIHMEALTLVARQSSDRTKKLLGSQPMRIADKIQSLNREIKECSFIEESCSNFNGDFVESIERIFNDIILPLQPKKIIETWNAFIVKTDEVCDKQKGSESTSWNIVECSIYQCIAKLVNEVVAILHKASELALVSDEIDSLILAQQFNEVCGVVSAGLEKRIDKICEAITDLSSVADPNVNKIITNIYLQSAQGNDILEESLKHLATILQEIQTKSLLQEM